MMGVTYNHKVMSRETMHFHYNVTLLKNKCIFFKGTIASQVQNTTIDHRLAYVNVCRNCQACEGQ